MRRLGTGAEIRELIAKIRAKLPRAVIRTSLIAGLPGEGEAEFNELCDFLRTAQLERAGVFTFSPEEGTEAYGMRRPDGDTARERAELIGELQSRVMDDFNAARVGTIETVLTDGLDEDGRTLARSYAESPDIDGYIVLEGENLADGTFYLAEITAHENGTLTARAVKEKNP
jgi:ribosomal protein S12 methylthiotransferase